MSRTPLAPGQPAVIDEVQARRGRAAAPLPQAGRQTRPEAIQAQSAPCAWCREIVELPALFVHELSCPKRLEIERANPGEEDRRHRIL